MTHLSCFYTGFRPLAYFKITFVGTMIWIKKQFTFNRYIFHCRWKSYDQNYAFWIKSCYECRFFYLMVLKLGQQKKYNNSNGTFIYMA